MNKNPGSCNPCESIRLLTASNGFLGIICPVWLLPSRLNRFTPRDVVALPKELNNDPGYFEEEPGIRAVSPSDKHIHDSEFPKIHT